MIRRPPRSTQSRSSAASDVYKRQYEYNSDRIEKNGFFDPMDDFESYWPSWIQKVLTVISCNWAPGKAGNASGQIFSIWRAILIAFDPVGSKKCWRWFPATGPLEKRETALDRSWRKLQFILRRGKLISTIFEANVHANVLKGTLSTDCKSNCMRIGSKNNTTSLLYLFLWTYWSNS